MAFINGINELANTLLIIISPIILMVFSGYTIGRVISKVRKVNPALFRDLIYGNIMLNFLFVSGFIFFGVLTSAARGYFSVFTFTLIILSVIGIYLMLKSIISRKIKLSISYNTNILFLFGVALFAAIIVYYAIIILDHPIFSEFDGIYLFLPASKSILLGDGLNYDFYTGSDVAIRLPPLNQALNAWLIHSFEYYSLRIFPIYFVFLASLFVYSFGRSITKDSFLGLIASLVFLITPSLLVVSSNYSLNQDLSFISFLTASFYFLSEIVRSDKYAKTHLMMLIITLSLLSLTREIGLIISIAIFFMVPAIKFTKDNLKLRALFTVLSFLPLYSLTFYDLLVNGISNIMILRVIILLVANLATFYILYQVKNQNQFSTLIPHFKYLIPLVIPLIFIISNMIIIKGPFPTLLFSHEFNQSIALYRQIFNDIPFVSSQIINDPYDILRNLPRIDILFISVAMGSIFIFFKLLGIARLIRSLKNNSQYAMILILLIFLLVVWSYLLHSGFEGPSIRHVLYFLPLFSVIFVIGVNRKESHYKLYYYGVIVFATFYFLFYELFIWNYYYFDGFFIEPKKSSIMTPIDLAIGAALIIPWIIFRLKEQEISKRFKKYNLQRYSIFVLMALLGIQLYTLSSISIMLAPLEKIDARPSQDWESYVFEVIDYLRSAESGNVLSLRVPAIPFFTNRTSFDMYSPHVVASIFPLLLIENATQFKQKISDMGIRYIVIPNEKSSEYNLVQNFMKISKIVEIIKNDPNFERVNLQHFDVYKYNPISYGINLIDQSRIWKPFNFANVSNNNNGTLNNIAVNTSNILTYQNSPYGISIQYPANWTKNEKDYDPNDNITNIVSFSSPLTNRFDNYSETLLISIKGLSNQSMTLKEYATSLITDYNKTLTDFKVIESNTNITLAGANNSPAYGLIYTDREDGINYKTMEIGTISGDRIYFIDYIAEEKQYSNYLPTIQMMTNSFEINKNYNGKQNIPLEINKDYFYSSRQNILHWDIAD
jgi:hypothetical protein